MSDLDVDLLPSPADAPVEATGVVATEYDYAANLVAITDPTGLAAESIRALRTHLMAQHIREGRRSLAMCSPVSGSGCTFIATNLAISLARAGVKTLLIDANLRTPGVVRLIRPHPTPPGLSDYLSSGTLSMGETIQSDVIPDLSIMYAGDVKQNAQELLAGNGFKTLIDNCMRDFDLTIVDTPCSNRYADALRVATVLRYAMIVAARNTTYVGDVKTLVADLRADRAHVIGTFLNDF